MNQNLIMLLVVIMICFGFPVSLRMLLIARKRTRVHPSNSRTIIIEITDPSTTGITGFYSDNEQQPINPFTGNQSCGNGSFAIPYGWTWNDRSSELMTSYYCLNTRLPDDVFGGLYLTELFRNEFKKAAPYLEKIWFPNPWANTSTERCLDGYDSVVISGFIATPGMRNMWQSGGKLHACLNANAELDEGSIFGGFYSRIPKKCLVLDIEAEEHGGISYLKGERFVNPYTGKHRCPSGFIPFTMMEWDCVPNIAQAALFICIGI